MKGSSALRVGVVSPFFPAPGDSVTGSFVLDHATALAAEGATVSVVAPVPWTPWPLSFFRRFAPYAEIPRRARLSTDAASIEISRPRYVRPPGKWFRPWAGPAMGGALRGHLAEIDVVVAHTLLPGGAAALRAAASRIPVITVTHGSDLLQHATESRSTRRVVARVMNESAAVVAVSDALAETARAWGGRAPVFTVANGVDVDRFEPWAPAARHEERAALGLDQRPVVLFVGLDVQRKGLDLLLEAHRALPARGPRPQLVIVGAQGAPETDVLWLGRQPRDEMPRLTALADVVVLPSREEAFGISLLEAAACGVPAVASRVQGIREVVDDQQTGLLVKPEDSHALTDALEQLLVDPERRARLGAAARSRVVERFSWRAHAVRMLEIIDRVRAPETRGDFAP